MLIRAALFVFLGSLIVWTIWLGFMTRASHEALEGIKASLVENEVARIRLGVEMWYASNYDAEEIKAYRTHSYDEFKNKLTAELTEKYYEMPVDLPDGKNFTEFSYSGNNEGYKIKVKAKDKKGTLIYGTHEKVWQETGG
jgi:hypothetical protein